MTARAFGQNFAPAWRFRRGVTTSRRREGVAPARWCVFIEQGQQSRDKLMSSGQNVAIKDATVGYYLFCRSDAARGALAS
jgi:hypothetical protein